MEDVLIPLFGCLMIFGIVAVSVWGATQSKKELNETIRRAIDSGQKLDADTINSLGRPVRTPAADIRGGIVLVFLGLGLTVGGLMASGVFYGKGFHGGGGATGLFVAAAIVGAIGIGQLVAGAVRGGDKKKET